MNFLSVRGTLKEEQLLLKVKQNHLYSHNILNRLPLLSLNQPNCKALSDLLYCLILDLFILIQQYSGQIFWKAVMFPSAVFTSLNIGGSKLVLSSGS